MLEKIKRGQTIEAKGGVISITSDNILLFEPNEGVTKMTLEDLQDHVPKFSSLVDKPVPLISDNRCMTFIGSKEKSFVKNNLHLFASHQALIVGGPISKFIVNTFLMLYQPKVETRSFTTPEEAYVWAKTLT